MEEADQQKIYFGSCGWSHEEWRGMFYPEHLPQTEWLARYARSLGAVEVDFTFYHPPTAHAAAHWLEQTPEEFRFAFKMPRTITHERKLRGCEKELEEFLEALEPMRPRLACVLMQLPPSFTAETDDGALRHFLPLLAESGMRFAIEFRHASWHAPRMVHLLETHRICRVWNDLSPFEKRNEGPFEFHPQTTDWLYVRLVGGMEAAGEESKPAPQPEGPLPWPRGDALESWAMKISKHLGGCSAVYAFAGNQFEGFAPLTCQRLAGKLGVEIDLSTPPTAEASDGRQGELRLT